MEATIWLYGGDMGIMGVNLEPFGAPHFGCLAAEAKVLH